MQWLHGASGELCIMRCSEFNRYLQIIVERAVSDLKAEARRGYLGMLWWVVEPVLYMAAFYVVFAILFNRGGIESVSFLLVGLVVWKWFAASIPACASSIHANRGLIGQIYVPKFVFPCMVLATSSMKFLMILAILLLFLLSVGIKPAVAWFALPLLVLLQLVMMMALGFFLAAVVPLLPDLKLVVDNGMLLLFFLSGIFFDVDSVSSGLATYLYLNPMLGLIEAYRSILLSGAWPDVGYCFRIAGSSLALLYFGVLLLRKYDRQYIKLI